MRINGVTYHHPLANITNGAGAAGGAPVPTGKSYSFDGVDDYVLADGAASIIDFNNDPHSVSVWFKIAPTAVSLSALWSFTNSSAGNSRYWLSIAASGAAVVYGWGNSGGVYPVGSGGAPVTAGSGLDDDAWHNIIVTYNGSNTLKAYIDGGSPASFTISAGAITSDTLAFGARRLGGATSYAADAKIHQLSIYNSELTAGEVAAVYGGGTPPDETTLTPAPLNYYRFGNGDTLFPTLKDYGSSPQDGTAVNMTVASIVDDAPP